MMIKITPVACLIMAVFSTSHLLAAETTSPLVFNTTTPQNDLAGTLAARVQFAQSQILPARPKMGDNQPTLTSLRKSLLMVQPLQADDVTPMQVEARDSNGKLLGSLMLSPPSALPKTVYHLSGSADFSIPGGASGVISSSADLARLSDKSGSFLKTKLTEYNLVEIKTADGQWVSKIYLPDGAELNGKMVKVSSNASYSSSIYYSGRNMTISRGQTLQFKFADGQWYTEGEVDNSRITYALNTWSGVLPAEWIRPGLALSIHQGNLSGELTGVKIGAPGELLLHTIDIGMLTTPRGQFAFATDTAAQREYFQTIPASRMIVNQYAPLYLQEVMLPDGTLLTDYDPSNGGWHEGTMRQRIGKELISLGIDNANYGINSTAGTGESSHPFVVAQLAAHNSRGKYANGVQVHGGSGGGGIVTLDSSLGNEFSHEVGHNYGLGHYVDGFQGSVHRSADNINSTWSWDGDKNRFIPNFFPAKTNQDACLNGECQAPFSGHKFGFDAMAGGSPFSSANRFTTYTPNSAAIIQKFLEKKAVFDRRSSTGFSKWNAETAQMEPYEHRINGVEQANASPGELSESQLTALFSQFQLVNVAMRDGYWTDNIMMPAASSENRGRILTVNHQAGYNSNLFINGGKIVVNKGYQKSFTSDGQRWRESAMINTQVARKPEKFGIPVTTLVGYYDPQGILTSYIYPALHGAYGFTYPDDSAGIANSDCQLQVESKSGLMRFKLANNREQKTVMNKFHINVPTEVQPDKATVVCRGQRLAVKTLSAAPTDISYTVQGRVLPANDNEGCIISNETGDKYCLPVGERSGYSLPGWIYKHEVYVNAGANAKVLLSDWDNLSYNRIGEFTGMVDTSAMKNVKAWDGQYRDFSKPQSMRVIGK